MTTLNRRQLAAIAAAMGASFVLAGRALAKSVRSWLEPGDLFAEGLASAYSDVNSTLVRTRRPFDDGTVGNDQTATLALMGSDANLSVEGTKTAR